MQLLSWMFWKRQARTWHWMSGAICLIGMLMFSVTGITLNHAHQITAEPVTTEKTATLPDSLLATISVETLGEAPEAMPASVTDYLKRELNVDIGGRPVEWSDYDAYVALPRPGGDGWVSIDRGSGEIIHEATSRGVVAFLNDLHKGRDTGPAWGWFIDVFAVASVLFCLTGLWLMQMSASRRPSTWPITIAGLAIPVLLIVLFMHV